MPSGPSTTSGGSVTARTYMKPHSGMRLRVAMAQNGILRRCLAACTYTGSGFGGGGAAGAGAAVRAGGPDAAGAAAGVVVAGVVAGALEAASGVAGRVGSGVATLADRGAPLARPLQEMFGDLGHFADDRCPCTRTGNLPSDRSRCTYAQPGALVTTCVPDFALLVPTTTVHWRMSRLVGERSVLRSPQSSGTRH